jgi:hypothetical protein
MKKIAVERLPPEFAALLEDLEQGRVLITRGGEPFAVVASVGFRDEEDLELEESPEFWNMVEERRRESGAISLEELRAQLDKENQEYSAGAVDGRPTGGPSEEPAKDANDS